MIVMMVVVKMVMLALLVTETGDRLIFVVENIARPSFLTGMRSAKDSQTVFSSFWVRGTFLVVARGCVSRRTAFD
jgi:hypothetical protein